MIQSFFKKPTISLAFAIGVGTTATIAYSEQTAQEQRQMSLLHE